MKSGDSAVSKARGKGSISRVLPVEAPAAFRAITDLTRLPEWNAKMTRVMALPEHLDVGAEWVVEFEVFGRRWKSRSRVDDIDAAGLRFAHRTQTDDGNPSFANWLWEVEPLPSGCRVTASWDLHPVTFWRRTLLGRIRNHQLARREVPASLAALAEIVGTSRPSTSKPAAHHQNHQQNGDVMSARTLQCPCGITLTGSDDEELFRLGRQHADEHHPGDNITDEFIREQVQKNARDAEVA
jgi:uncharacterized protein YndB with AHSA1/START domain